MKYQITLNENQLSVIREALEEYFRVSLNQWKGLATRLAFLGFPNENDNKPRSDEFDERAMISECVQTAFKYAGRVAFTPERLQQCKTEEVRSAIDMWRIVRYALCTDEQRKMFVGLNPQSSEPLIEVNRIE